MYPNIRYKIINTIGQGGMGIVYATKDTLTDNIVALKQMLYPETQFAYVTKASNDDAKYVIAREFRILASLRHPNVLSVLDYGFDDNDLPYYTMPILNDAQTIMEASYWCSDIYEKISLIIQLLQALHYLHQQGVVHRDLKPDNVLVTKKNVVKVMDFGLATSEWMQSESDKQEEIAGTLRYMAPELFQDGQASIQSDLYAIGIIMCQMLTGKHPFESNNIATLLQQVLLEEVNLDDIDTRLQPCLKNLMMKDPAKRPNNAYDVIQELCKAYNLPLPEETHAIRESFLQSATFVGRRDELKTLREAISPVLAGETAFYLVGGVAGVGKTRLLDELRIHALVSGLTVLTGQAVEGSGLPFQLWRDIIRYLVPHVSLTDKQASILKDILPNIGDILGHDIPDPPELLGSAYQDRLSNTIIELLMTINKPILLLLEDLQWSTESLEPLKQILNLKDTLSRLMIVANYRHEESPDLPDTLQSMTHILLDRLSSSEVRELATSILGKQVAQDNIIEFLQTQTEGNTFFIVETARSLAEDVGSLNKIGSSPLPNNILTGRMEQVLQSRLNQVETQYLPIQKLAATIGREVDIKLLQHVFDASMIEDWLVNGNYVSVLTSADTRWRFTHDKLRMSLIQNLEQEEVILLNRQAAEAIEATYVNVSNYEQILLEHWLKADDIDKIFYYLLPVVKRLIELVADYDLAKTYLEQVLSTLSQEDARRAPLYHQLSRIMNIRGQRHEAREIATLCLQIATKHDDVRSSADAMRTLANLATDDGNYDEAHPYYDKSKALYTKLEDQIGVAHVLRDLGSIAYNKEQMNDAMAYYQKAKDIHVELGNAQGEAEVLLGIGNILRRRGNKQESLDCYNEVLAICEKISDLRGKGTVLLNMAVYYDAIGDRDRALDNAEKSLTISRKIGYQTIATRSQIKIGQIYLKQERYDDALAQGFEAYEQSQSTHRKSDTLHALVLIGGTFSRIGDVEESANYFQKALKIAFELEQHDAITVCLQFLGELAYWSDKFEESQSYFQQVYDLTNKKGENHRMVSLSLNGIGFCQYKQGQYNLAASTFAHSLDVAQKLSSMYALYPCQYNVLGFAYIFKQKGDFKRACELLAFAKPDLTELEEYWQVEINNLQQEIEANLTLTEIAEMTEKASHNELDDVVNILLTEFAR